MARQKIVLIGAGSVNFTQVLVADFARTCPSGGLCLALVGTASFSRWVTPPCPAASLAQRA
jgi:hypothetical protein